jgi:hypothetical protein
MNNDNRISVLGVARPLSGGVNGWHRYSVTFYPWRAGIIEVRGVIDRKRNGEARIVSIEANGLELADEGVAELLSNVVMYLLPGDATYFDEPREALWEDASHVLMDMSPPYRDMAEARLRTIHRLKSR